MLVGSHLDPREDVMLEIPCDITDPLGLHVQLAVLRQKLNK